MLGFPFGTFLFWKVEPQRSGDWKFYDFVRDYHERDAPHCPELGPISERALTAILDGQQRLTALNIGLRGSLSLRRKYGWKDNPNAYPKWQLYLNLRSKLEDEESREDGPPLTADRYQFKFMEPPQNDIAAKEFWFSVTCH